MFQLLPSTKLSFAAAISNTIARQAEVVFRAAPFRAIFFVVGLFILMSSSLHAQERQVVHRVAPVYPPIARQMRLTGSVRVVATVDPTGTVVKTESESPVKLLVPAAEDAVKHWKFAPSSNESTVTVQVNFEPN